MKKKRGFGLMEVLVAMIVLALMFTAVMELNLSNHQAALRIATRNEAATIGQRVLDSLQVLGVARVAADEDTVVGDSTRTQGEKFRRTYIWKTVVTDDSSTVGPAGLKVKSLRSRKVDLVVRWTLDGHENSISLSTVVE